MKRFLVLLLLSSPAFAGTPPLVENGNGTSTLTLTYQTFNWMEVCKSFKPEELTCGHLLDMNGDGTPQQWAVEAGHCTAQEATDGVAIKDAAAYGSPDCTGANVTNNRCRDATDPGPDQSGYVIVRPAVCQDFLAGMLIAHLRQWRDRGLSLLEQENAVLGSAPPALED